MSGFALFLDSVRNLTEGTDAVFKFLRIFSLITITFAQRPGIEGHSYFYRIRLTVVNSETNFPLGPTYSSELFVPLMESANVYSAKFQEFIYFLIDPDQLNYLLVEICLIGSCIFIISLYLFAYFLYLCRNKRFQSNHS